ncbi:hypothetical protein SEA_EFFIE_610 [Acinetobacter phage Effie]|nr:hypothetical protein SEA_EFFIE_610 [Acinetobacter phage Effie]
MATYELLYPKGEALGFTVNNVVRDQINESIDFLESLNLELMNFSVMTENSATVTYTNATGGFHQTLHLVPEFVVYQENSLPLARSKSEWEHKGFVFDGEGHMYESAESLTALRLEGFLRDKFSQVIDWCEQVGLAFVSFAVNDDNCIILNIDGLETEPMGSGDYLIQAPHGLEVHTKESLIEEGYIFTEDEI